MKRLLPILLLWGGVAQAANYQFFVATNGNDSWSGTLSAPNGGNTDGPFATLGKARDAIKALNPIWVSYVPTNAPSGSGTNIISWWCPALDKPTTNASVWRQPDRSGVNTYDWTNNGAASTWPTYDGTNLSFDLSKSQCCWNTAYTSSSPHEVVMMFMDTSASNITTKLIFMDGTPSSGNLHRFMQDTDVGWYEKGASTGKKFMYPLTNVFTEIDMLFNASLGTVYTNNVLATDNITIDSPYTTSGINMGSRYDHAALFASMQLKEVITYKAALSLTDKGEIYNYLQTAKGSSQPTNSFIVYVEDGRYFTDTETDFGALDSGSASVSIQYRNYPNHNPRIIGGRLVSSWSAVTDGAILARLTASAQTNVVKADLSSFPALLAVTRIGYPPASWLGANELVFNGQPMQVARYPNSGWLQTGTTNTFAPGVFACSDSHPYTWAASTEIQANGYWRQVYANSTEMVTNINSGAQTIGIKSVGGPSTPIPDVRYNFQNVLEELDSPGEYYIDRTGKLIYFWPPTSVSTGEAILTTAPIVLNFLNAQNLSFYGISFEGGLQNNIEITSGANITFDHCVIKNGSGAGLNITNATSSGFTHGTIQGMGQLAACFNSGDRTTLTPSSCYISNSYIHDFARLDRTYEPAVRLDGVGNWVSRCKIYNTPGTGILLGGNNMLVEYTEFVNCAYEPSDVGVIYSAEDWSQTGHTLRYNYIHDCVLTNGPIISIPNTNSTETVGIYLDDFRSGVLIHNTCIANVNIGVEVGGGRNNTITNMLFPNCWGYTFVVDQRLVTLPSSYLTTLSNELVALPYQTPPWSTQYPWLSNIFNDSPTLAMHNLLSTEVETIRSNRVASGWVGYQLDGSTTNFVPVNFFASTNTDNAGTVLPDPLFVNFNAENFRFQANSPATNGLSANTATNFTAIPFDQIGPIPEFTLNATTLNVGTSTFYK